MLGAESYPSTLNLILDWPVCFDPAKAVFRNPRHAFWPVRLGDLFCLAHRWSRCPMHMVELVAPHRLRDTLNDGDRVRVTFAAEDILPIHWRTRFVWAALFMHRRSGGYDNAYLRELAIANYRALRMTYQPFG